jgi:hypothetical protein
MVSPAFTASDIKTLLLKSFQLYSCTVIPLADGTGGDLPIKTPSHTAAREISGMHGNKK